MKTLYIFDVDDTLINTQACVRAIDANGNILFRAGTKVFNAPNSTERLLTTGMTWDFSEFESYDQLIKEPHLHAMDVLKSQIGRDIHIITARQCHEELYAWLYGYEGVDIKRENIHCYDRNYPGTVAEWKASVLDRIISQCQPSEVEIYEDDENNLKEMVRVCNDNEVWCYTNPF